MLKTGIAIIPDTQIGLGVLEQIWKAGFSSRNSNACSCRSMPITSAADTRPLSDSNTGLISYYQCIAINKRNTNAIFVKSHKFFFAIAFSIIKITIKEYTTNVSYKNT